MKVNNPVSKPDNAWYETLIEVNYYLKETNETSLVLIPNAGVLLAICTDILSTKFYISCAMLLPIRTNFNLQIITVPLTR